MPSSHVTYTAVSATPPVPSSQEPKVTNTVTSTDFSDQSVQKQILHELRQLNRIQAELASEAPLRSQAVWNFVLQGFGVVVGALFGVFAILAWKAADEANGISDRANSMASTANDIASRANDLAAAANKLALAAYCQSQTNNNSDVCARVQASASASVAAFASSLYQIHSVTTIITSTRTNYVYSTTVVGSGSTTRTSRVVTGTSLQVITTTSFMDSGAGNTPLPNPSSDTGASSPGRGTIAGLVVGVIVGAVILGAAAWSQYLVYRKKARKSQQMKDLAKVYDARVE